MNIEITEKKSKGFENLETELVERKGLGHPDSICDGVAEAVSRALCSEYRSRFGKVLHHNTDEAQLIAGEAEPEFGGGELKEKIEIVLTGRATKELDGERIPVEEIAVKAAESYIDENFQKLSSDQINFIPKIGETSTDLETVFSEQKPLANDTSFGVGHAPLSPVETAVKRIEEDLRNCIEEVGDDVKVMGLKRGEELKVTVAAAVLSEKIENLEQYKEVKDKIQRKTEELVEEETVLIPTVNVNSADNMEEGVVYITYTGTSAENGDDGSVGRGNRVNGLITPYRPMSLEAASGKNPVTHIGKIYNILADQIAKKIHNATEEPAEVKVLSQIGKPLDEPQVVHVESSADKDEIRRITAESFENIEEISDRCINGEIETF